MLSAPATSLTTPHIHQLHYDSQSSFPARHESPPLIHSSSTTNQLRKLYSSAVDNLPAKQRLDNISRRLMNKMPLSLEDEFLSTPLESLVPSPEQTPDPAWNDLKVCAISKKNTL